MENIGKQILDARKRKGYSQNELAELTGLNIRTIQRIEKGETEPRGHSMRKLFEALDLEPEEVLDYGKREDIGLIQVLHLSVLAGLVIPLGNILAPLIIWIANRNKIQRLDTQAKNLIFWQSLFLSLIIFVVLFLFFGIITTDVGSQISWIAFPIFVAISVFIFALYPIIITLLMFKYGVRNYYPRVFR